MNHFRTEPPIPNQVFRQWRRVEWSIVSNAAERSSNIRAVGSPLDKDRWTSFFIKRRAVSVEWPVLYADWYGLSKLWTWICSNNCLATTREGEALFNLSSRQAHPFEKHVFGHVTSLIGWNVMTPYSEIFPGLLHTCAEFEENPPSGWWAISNRKSGSWRTPSLSPLPSIQTIVLHVTLNLSDWKRWVYTN